VGVSPDLGFVALERAALQLNVFSRKHLEMVRLERRVEVPLGRGEGFEAKHRRDVMQAAQTCFISSTYWTERIGFVAALETIKIFQRDNVAMKITEMGEYLSKGLKDIFKKYSLKIDIGGNSSMLIMNINEDNPLLIKTVFTQEMLKEGFLATTVIYISSEHTKTIVDCFLDIAEKVFSRLSEALKAGVLEKMLEGPICHAGFKRVA
jgi:4-aminobutyrate aminotransferase-like enzyme